MELFNILALIITLAALFSYVNYRFIGLPTTIGVMAIALVASIGLVVLGSFEPRIGDMAFRWVHGIHFDETLLQGMLSFLLFAGALNININDLAEQKWTIGALALFGTLISTLLVGVLAWVVFGQLGIAIGPVYCLLFGALISPTDPIAVLGILKRAGAPKSLETKITGESLFNDGVGVVLFLVLLQIAAGGGAGHEAAGHAAASAVQDGARVVAEMPSVHVEGALDVWGIILLFMQEAAGGAIFGLGVGYLAFRLLRSVDNYQVEVMLTLALVTGGYALASVLHLSGPIAIVVAGLLVGNTGRLLAMSEETRHHLDIFWELVDEILNAVLFVMIGLEMIVLTLNGRYLAAGLLILPVVLLARLAAVGLPVALMRPFRRFTSGAVRIMTWGGLRGGISVALALSLPDVPERGPILTVTYIVVVFSILIQGLTIGRVIRRLVPPVRA